jgi:hypothetical protein
MENNEVILSDQTVSKEYQIPELVDLNSISEAMGQCSTGSGNNFSWCATGVGP